MVDNFIIHAVQPAPSQELIQAFLDIPTTHISDNLRRLDGITGLRKIHRSRKLIGTAVTVKTRPGDNLVIYKAASMLLPGHVLVVDAGGATSNAIVGDLLMEYARQRQCAGFVIDGAVRDSAAFFSADFPCYARDVVHRGPFKTGPGSINVDITVGGQVVNPGDVLVGDEDGIVAFPAVSAEQLLQAARQTAEAEQRVRSEILNGEVRQSWLDKMFVAHGLT